MAEWNVFVSYSRLDREIVVPLTQLMRITGGNVFRDEDSINFGKQWRVVVAESIASARTVLVFWSGNSASSEAVQEEYTQAISQGKDIVPVVLDDSPLPPILAEYQWLDFRPFIKRPSGVAAGSSVIGGLLGMFFFGPVGAAIGTLAGKPPQSVRDDLSDSQKLELEAIVYRRITTGHSGPRAPDTEPG